jgi:NAD(P)-dependent dehydrogenase (short-subunit alcohol dehydrogenase family)
MKEMKEGNDGRYVATYGRLDCAFNNAGIAGAIGAFTHEYTDESWERVIGINLKGVWLCMKYEIPQILKARERSHCQHCVDMGIGGCAGCRGLRGQQTRVVGLTRTAALEYAHPDTGSVHWRHP